MFRNFDNHDFYIDNDRKILHGVIEFMIKDGNTHANIYDADKTPIANPQFTDINGRTEIQVFVDSDVIAYVYKYVGEGRFIDERQDSIDTSDQSKWALQYTVESASIDERAITGESAMGVPDIDTLRAIDPSEVPEIYGNKIVTLEGYYEAGDCEPVRYIWDSESDLNDDNGSVIKGPELTGRWILVQPTEHCDSRHFGIFPQDSDDAEIDHSTRIGQLIGYCNTKSIHPYFNGSQGYPYFIYQSIAYVSRNAIDVSNDTIFVDNGTGNRLSGELNGNPYFLNANTQVNSKTVRHSWHFGSFGSNTNTYIVDSTWSPVILDHMKVVFEVNPHANCHLTDCEVESNELINTNIIMQDMTVRTDWFADNYDWSKLSITGCNIQLKNCKDADTYIILKHKQNEADYGDLGEQTVSNTTLLENALAENAVFSNVTLQGATELHNVSGSVVFGGSNVALNAVDCFLFNGTAATVASMSIRRGALGGSAIVSIGDVYLNDVDVSTDVSTANKANVEYSRISDGVCVSGGVLIATGNELRGTASVTATAPSSTITADISGNRFLGTSKFAVSKDLYTITNFHCDIRIVGNMSDHDFVDDTSFTGFTHNIAAGSHWSYEGNFGGCPVTTAKEYSYIPYAELMPPDPGYGARWAAPLPSNQPDNAVSLVYDMRGMSGGNAKWQTWWYFKYTRVLDFDSLNLFRWKNLKLSRGYHVCPKLETHFTTVNRDNPSVSYGTSVVSMELPYHIEIVDPDRHTCDLTGDYTHQLVASAPYDVDQDDWLSRLGELLHSGATTVQGMSAMLTIDIG